MLRSLSKSKEHRHINTEMRVIGRDGVSRIAIVMDVKITVPTEIGINITVEAKIGIVGRRAIRVGMSLSSSSITRIGRKQI